MVAARQRIAGGVALTPCPESIPLSELTGCRVFCKLDYLQRTGSFKERGARNALLQLDDQQRKRGVVTQSAGNHALGLAYHGHLLGIPVTVVMPRFAPIIKSSTCRRLGATVIHHGDSFLAAREHALHLAQKHGYTYIHGFDHPDIIAGQGTAGLEILEQVPDVEAIICPIGGAGLIAGVALAVKTMKPRVQIFGVEAANMPSFSAALKAGEPVDVPSIPTLADGLAVGRVGALPFAIARKLVDRVVLASEEQLSLAVLRLVELEKAVVEGAAAAPLAALMGGLLPEVAGRTVVLTLCGGNIDPVVLGRVIEKGLAADGRLARFTATISDRPGGLAAFAQAVSAAGASIKQVTHDREFSGPSIAHVNVQCIVETADREHLMKLFDTLRAAGFVVRE
ncbi:MAG: threonine ammonia-lyase [Phycisphaerae bacterium]|nr:threonine ammonia-lyase [Phycisphaerae bacterium]MDW8262464.1 threonine ammonia-lyase [Phycisphaerales bacterium]